MIGRRLSPSPISSGCARRGSPRSSFRVSTAAGARGSCGRTASSTRLREARPRPASCWRSNISFTALCAPILTSRPALKDKIFRSAAEDGAFVNSLRVEPELGTPIRGGLPATIARRTPTGWALSGRKIYATGSPVLAWNAIWARTDEAEPRVGPFIVPAGAPGFAIEETWRQLGMRASGSHDVVLDNVEIPFDHAADLKTLDELTGPDASQMAWVAVLFSTVYDGAARAARDWFVKFLRERAPTNLGAPLATLPRMQQAVGEIDSALYASRILLASIAERIDRGETPHPQESLYVKHNVTKNALDAVSKAMEFSGNPGLAQANPLERHYRDVLCARVHSPQNDSIFLSGGRLALADAPATL